ncbi:ZIP family metal transporter [Candidatus Bathyarchaeota archaeon]|nr:ZIP family metal transporter [Candidatus Bathyarchaeota archaeon]
MFCIDKWVILVSVWVSSLLSVLLVSLISLIGVVLILFRGELSKHQLMSLVGFSAGGMLGGAFLHLIPEAYLGQDGELVSLFLLVGIFSSYIVEMLLEWRHCHVPTCDEHPHSFAYVNLIGDGVHNFIDGLIIGGSYLVSFGLGLSTTMAVVLHEIPQEIGDFGVLLYAGMKPRRALLFNLASALTSVLGALLVLLMGARVQGLTGFLVPFAAGNFVYIAGSDLVPELKDQKDLGRSLVQLFLMMLGVGFMYLLRVLG